MRPEIHRDNRQGGGSSLIVVIWVIGILSVMIGSFAFEAHLEARITSYIRKRGKAEALAKSGLEVARLLMVKSQKVKGGQIPEDKQADDKWYDSAKTLSEGLPLAGGARIVETLGEGAMTVDIESEQGRRNINNLGANDAEKEDNLERILEVGGVPQDMWPVLIESFLDWTDPDNITRNAGAETEDYYSQVNPPYKARNGPIDDVEELLQIKGYTRAIIHGGVVATNKSDKEMRTIGGIRDLLTVYGDGKVNVNTASERVLRTLPNVDEITAKAIIEEREGFSSNKDKKENTSFKSVDDLYRRIPELDAAARKYMTTDSTIYRVTSVGNVGGVQFKIWAVVRSEGENMTILRWREND